MFKEVYYLHVRAIGYLWGFDENTEKVPRHSPFQHNFTSFFLGEKNKNKKNKKKQKKTKSKEQ